MSAFANTDGEIPLLGVGDDGKVFGFFWGSGQFSQINKAQPWNRSICFEKEIYTKDYLRKLGLNERQIKPVLYVKEKGR
nr:hypothetical protein [Thermococcus sp. GR6]